MLYLWYISWIKWQIGTRADISQQFCILHINTWVSLHFSLSCSSSPLFCCILKTSHITQLSPSVLNSIFYFFSFHPNVSVWKVSSILDTSQSGFSNFCSHKSHKNQNSELWIAPSPCSWPTNVVGQQCFFPISSYFLYFMFLSCLAAMLLSVFHYIPWCYSSFPSLFAVCIFSCPSSPSLLLSGNLFHQTKFT